MSRDEQVAEGVRLKLVAAQLRAKAAIIIAGNLVRRSQLAARRSGRPKAPAEAWRASAEAAGERSSAYQPGPVPLMPRLPER